MLSKLILQNIHQQLFKAISLPSLLLIAWFLSACAGAAQPETSTVVETVMTEKEVEVIKKAESGEMITVIEAEAGREVAEIEADMAIEAKPIP